MNKQEYSDLRKQIAKELHNEPLIMNHAYQVALFNNGNNASINISVRFNNVAYYKHFMKVTKEKYSDVIKYITFTKSDGSCASTIDLQFIEEDKICKEMLQI